MILVQNSICAPGCLRIRSARYKIDRIVIHIAEGTAAGTQTWFANPTRPVLTATHYLVAKNGTIFRFADERYKLYHAGSRTEAGWNDRSIGIEHEGWTDKADGSEAQLDASATLVRDIAARNKIPLDRSHIIGHCEIPGVDHTDPGPRWPWDAYMERLR